MELGLRDFLGILWRRRAILVSAVLFSLLTGGSIIATTTPEFRAVAKVEIFPVSYGPVHSPLFEEEETDPGWRRTQRELIESGPVLEAAANKANLSGGGSAPPTVTARLIPNTQLAEIAVQGGSSAQTVQWANAVAEAYIELRETRVLESASKARQNIVQQAEALEELIGELQNRPAGDQDQESLDLELQNLQMLRLLSQDPQVVKDGAASLISPAREAVQVKPNRAFTLVAALALGSAVGLAGALIREVFDDNPHAPEEIESLASAPILACVPNIGELPEEHLRRVGGKQPTNGPTAGAYQALSVNLITACGGEAPSSVLITSVDRSTASGYAAINLAKVLARSGREVILVSGDLREPTVHDLLRLSGDTGLIEAVLDPEQPVDQLLQNSSFSNLSVLAAGSGEVDPPELFSTQAFERVLEQLRSRCDVLILDAAPVSQCADAVVLAPKVDAVILAVAFPGTKGKGIRNAATSLRRAGGTLAGCIVADFSSTRKSPPWRKHV